jgi:IS5 family transposase
VVDAEPGLVHSVLGTAATVNNVAQASCLVHGKEANVCAHAGCQAVAKREETQDFNANWHVAMRPGKRRALNMNSRIGSMLDTLEQRKASIRASWKHPFRVIKRQFGHVTVRYRGLAKNMAQLHTTKRSIARG